MRLDPVLLSRLQWAWVIAWHILLPAFTVGLASYIAVLEGFYLLTRDEIWFRISGFWTKIFAVSFGMGVVSGIIMPFQFGTNWSRFTDATADVISPRLDCGTPQPPIAVNERFSDTFAYGDLKIQFVYSCYLDRRAHV